MDNYAGSTVTDKRPIGGGGYNKTRKGGELYNFKNIRGRLYGYFQPNMRSQAVTLERVDPQVVGDRLDDVLVIFIAPAEGGGQSVVGWYRHAVLHRWAVPTSAWPKRKSHLVSAKADDCVLVPTNNRGCRVPHGAGALGQSNVCYVLDKNGKPKGGTWIDKALRYVDDYRVSNQLNDSAAGADEESAEAAEREVARARGQGFPKTAEQRRAIELRAMEVAERHFRKLGYEVEDVHLTRSYDLSCTKGPRELHVEVKGTMTDGKVVILTKNEVKHARNGTNACALFICHSIKLKGHTASGGTKRVLDPWILKRRNLRPISFTYQV